MTDITWWWIALGAGLVVAAVATVLLQILLRQVRRIEGLAEQIWLAGKAVAGNTAHTWQLQNLSSRLGDLADEAGRHESLLRSKGA